LGLGAAALAVVAALYLPLQAKRTALAEVEDELRAARAAAGEVERLRRQVEDLRTRSNFVLDQRRRKRTITEILDEVTRRLPDHTWVLKFGVRGERLVLSGYSAKPSSLISLLEESEMLSDVRFSSPVTMDQKIGLERFNLTATVTPRETS
ncbi:MAG: hypothetical protein D6826_08310, partial [Alphaproteobacteria bacterium]